MASSKSNALEIKEMNQHIIQSLVQRKALVKEHAVFIEDLKLPYSVKIQYFLVEEFVKNDFITVLSDGKIFFNKKKYDGVKKRTQLIYVGILLFPFIIGCLLLVL